VLDPPRQGCPPEVIERVFWRSKPARVVYVSCNPDALASEMPAILDAGYDVERLQAVDMFPHTTHIETVVTFSRPSAPRRRASAPAHRGVPTPRARHH
jgi:23S rRNA (uracil1939-C5)-methyltransferase